MQEFEVYLVSNGSMQMYPENSLTSFTNLLAEPLSLEGEWKVALTEITTSTAIKNVVDTRFLGFTLKPDLDTIIGGKLIETERQTHNIPGGIYHNIDEIMETLKDIANVDVDWGVHPHNGKLSLTFKLRNGFSFPSSEIPSILGFKGMRHNFFGNREGLHIGFRQLHAADKREEFTLEGDYPVDLTAGKSIMFVYVNIIEYQTVADAKAPLLRVIPVDTKLRNNTILQTASLNHRSFKDLQFKSLLGNNIQSIKIELRNENGDLVPFVGNGRTVLTLKFHKIS